MSATRIVALFGLIALLAGCASVGMISGMLSAPEPPPDPAHGEPDSGSRASGGSIADAVIYVDKIGRDADSRLHPPQEEPRIELKGLTFRPRVLVVVAGTRVEFANRDTVFHNVFSASPSNRFDLGRYAPGESRWATFRRPGPVNVYCDLHPKMSAFVLVVPNRAFARADSLGRFALPPLPPGRYVVKVWHPDFPAVRRRVTVTGGEHAELEVTLGS